MNNFLQKGQSIFNKYIGFFFVGSILPLDENIYSSINTV